MTMKTFGHFDDKNREYVITDPATPFRFLGLTIWAMKTSSD